MTNIQVNTYLRSWYFFRPLHPSPINQKYPMTFSFDDPVLVLDDMPLIATGLQQVLRTLHPSITVEYAESVFRVLSAPAYRDRSFSVIVLGSAQDSSPGGLLLPAAE